MTVCIKYCGGCNPRYDRVGQAGAIIRDFPQHRFLINSGQSGADMLIVLCGCHVACADLSGFHTSLRTLLVRGEGDLPAVIDVLSDT